MSESVNVNTNTAQVSEPVVSGGAESPVSWDQLDSVSNFRHEVAKSEVKEEIKAEKEAKKELKVKDSEPKEEPKKEIKKAPAAEKEPEKVESKKLKIKHGDSDLDIPLDIQVPVKVNGKVEQVALQEALNRYSQQKHLDKIYQDFKKEKATFEKERGTMNQTLEKVHDLLVNKKDIRGFIELVAEPAGLDPSQVYEDMRSQWEQRFEEAQALSPEERKSKALEEEVTYYRQKKEQERQRQIETKQMQELEQSVESVLTDSGMDKATFVKSFDELVKLGFKAEELSPEHIGSYYRNMQTITRIESKLAETNPELAGDAATIEKLATLAFQTEATAEEIDAVISELYSNDAEKRLAKKINKSMAKAKAETPVKNGGKDPLFFDDI